MSRAPCFQALLVTIEAVPRRRKRTSGPADAKAGSADAEAALQRLFQAWRRGGKKGGPKGGKARWEGVPPEMRREIARNAALARWAKRRKRT
jgi:hypothetical protein